VKIRQGSRADQHHHGGTPERITGYHSEGVTQPRHIKGTDKAAYFITQSPIAVPTTFQGEKPGVLEMVNKTRNAHYTEEDQTILETLASRVVIVIQNTHLIKKVKESQEQMTPLDCIKSDFNAITSWLASMKGMGRNLKFILLVTPREPDAGRRVFAS
jgi:GAF domain-containing protein